MIVKIEIVHNGRVEEQTIFNFQELWYAIKFFRALSHWANGLMELMKK